MVDAFSQEFYRLGAIVESQSMTNLIPAEILGQVMAAQADQILMSFAPNREEIYKKMRRTAQAVMNMTGLTAEHEWFALPMLEKLRIRFKDGLSERAWCEARTRDLLDEGFKLAWPNKTLPMDFATKA